MVWISMFRYYSAGHYANNHGKQWGAGIDYIHWHWPVRSTQFILWFPSRIVKAARLVLLVRSWSWSLTIKNQSSWHPWSNRYRNNWSMPGGYQMLPPGSTRSPAGRQVKLGQTLMAGTLGGDLTQVATAWQQDLHWSLVSHWWCHLDQLIELMLLGSVFWGGFMWFLSLSTLFYALIWLAVECGWQVGWRKLLLSILGWQPLLCLGMVVQLPSTSPWLGHDAGHPWSPNKSSTGRRGRKSSRGRKPKLRSAFRTAALGWLAGWFFYKMCSNM